MLSRQPRLFFLPGNPLSAYATDGTNFRLRLIIYLSDVTLIALRQFTCKNICTLLQQRRWRSVVAHGDRALGHMTFLHPILSLNGEFIFKYDWTPLGRNVDLPSHNFSDSRPQTVGQKSDNINACTKS